MKKITQLTEKEPKVVFVKNVSEIVKKVKHLRKNQTYVLVDDSPTMFDSRRELAEMNDFLENMLRTQRHLRIRMRPAVAFTKRGVKE